MHDGRKAFEELLGGGPSTGPTAALDHFLSLRVPLDPQLMKIAEALCPAAPEEAYRSLGGQVAISRVKLAEAPKKQLKGGLRPGVSLFQHQKDAIEKVIAKDGNLLLSHPTGSGKTLTSIAAFEELRKKGMAEHALVVTPASLRTNYLENGIQKFTTSKGAIFGNAQEAHSGTHVTTEAPDPHAQYHIVSYELFRADPKKYIDASKADTVIYDELHRAKNEGVLTSKAIKDARQYHKNFIGMTGSIVSNTPADIVPLVDAMTSGKHLLGNKTTFESRFVQTDDKGNKKLRHPQVIRTLLGPYVHHLDHEDIVTSKTPKKVVEEVKVEMSPNQLDFYKYIKKDLDPITKMRLEMGVSGLNSAQLNDMFAQLIKLRQVSNSLHTIDSRISPSESAKITPKVKRVLDDVEDHLKETPDGQVVLHTNLIHGGVDVLTAGLKDRGIEHALFIGKGQPGVTEKSRQHGVQDFREGKKRVIVLSSAGGEGLDLPNATFMGMLDGHFNPEKILQAEARGIRAGGLAHRPEKERNVLVRRYVTVIPTSGPRRTLDVAQNIWKNVNPKEIITRLGTGGPGFFNPFRREESTDEWVYGVATRKAGLNKALRENLKVSSAQVPEFSTHEEFEEWMTDGIDKVALNLEQLVSASQRFAPAVTIPLGIAAGLLRGGTAPRSKREAEQDPNAPMRNRIAGLVGGAAGGLLAAPIMASGHPIHAMYALWRAPAAAKSLADIAAPARSTPKSVLNVLGKRDVYSDRALFEKYWEHFGKELEHKGPKGDITDKELEQKFVTALHDLYAETKAPGANIFGLDKGGNIVGKPTKKGFIGAATAGMLVSPSGPLLSELWYAQAQDRAPALGPALAAAVPDVLQMGGELAQAYRRNFLDPGVAYSNRAEAKTRSRFSEDQLRDLLRGLSVEEVKTKQHVIK